MEVWTIYPHTSLNVGIKFAGLEKTGYGRHKVRNSRLVQNKEDYRAR